MTEKIIDPKTNPEEAAQQALIELVRSAGADLFKSRSVTEDSGEKAASFLIAFHKALTEHYRSLQ